VFFSFFFGCDHGAIFNSKEEGKGGIIKG